ncbi:hypothetical protein KSF_023650 [Reticulibacter mediterranei]|uniref:Uncharacterized protein n=1 Tax=Reticulibacter mediterranei TaxID=2778369 RepID=A0A8J3MZW1_9CHLR|nr:hypothetical protein KSF_023650 [Reticulibacter mediterranei]
MGTSRRDSAGLENVLLALREDVCQRRQERFLWISLSLSLLRPDELEKLQKYVITSLAMQNREEKGEKHPQRERFERDSR